MLGNIVFNNLESYCITILNKVNKTYFYRQPYLQYWQKYINNNKAYAIKLLMLKQCADIVWLQFMGNISVAIALCHDWSIEL